MAQQLPTWTQIADHAVEELSKSRSAASEAASWLRSDWSPVDTSLTDEASDARIAVAKRIGRIKELIDMCKADLQNVRDHQTK